jgi:hypothetical protein
MAQTNYTPIQLYYSTTGAAAPTAGNLANGELAINITDGKLFYKDNLGAVQVLATKAGASGDVVGPGSSTDNALVRFDSTTGKLVQNSVGLLSDTGDLTGLNSITLITPLGVASGGTGSSSTTFVNLATNVTGTLPVANGGTGTATPGLVQGANITITGTWPNQTIAAAFSGTGTVTSVGGTCTVNGITLMGTVTSSGNLTLGGTLSGVNLASQVTGTLPVANGGTGQTTLTGLALPQPVITQNVQVIGTNTTAVASRIYVLTASLTLTLPASPSAGNTVTVSNMSGAITAVIGRNSQPIMALAEDLTVDLDGAGFTLVYADATRGWVLLP